MAIYSHSRLSTFETCPRNYWYAYVGRVEVPEVETVEAFLGSRVHEALQDLYQQLVNGRLMSREELLACYEGKWQRQWSDQVQIVRREYTADDYRQVGRDALAAYYQRYAPFSQSRTLRLEARVLWDLDDQGQYRMQGYIDRLARRPDGTYEIHDYKTSGHLPTQAAANADRQLALYQLGLHQMWDDVQAVDLIWHYLRFDQEIRSRRTREQLDEVTAQCVAVIADIESRGREEGHFPTKPSALCEWCAYQQICPATRHAVATAALPPAQFEADDGVRLVDQWAQISEQRASLADQDKILEAAEEQVKQRLLAFARQQGLEAVVGSTYHAELIRTTEMDYPHAGDERRESFEKTLARLNLLDDLVTVNAQKLRSLCRSMADLPPRVRHALRPFLTESETIDLKLRPGGGRDIENGTTTPPRP